MKFTVKIISLLICIVMLASQLSSCGYVYEYITDFYNDIYNDIYIDNIENDGDYVFDIVYPEVTISELEFDLTDEHLVEYKDKLSIAMRVFSRNESGSEDSFRDLLYEILSLEAYMITQCDIAYLQYYYNTADTEAWNNYLYAYEMCDEAHDMFWGFYADAKQEDTALAEVFKDLVEKEYDGKLITVTAEADGYAYEMEVLEGEYNSLINKGASEAKIFEVYKEYMIAAYNYANAAYTDNYYEYASKYIYYRDDTPEQREMLREYTKQYLIPLYRELKAKSEEYDSRLTGLEFSISEKYLLGKYDSFDKNYLMRYFSSLPDASEEAILSAFEKDRVIIGDKPKSYNTAMVCTVGNTPICYFHEDLTTLDTMSHELGHYYARVVGDSSYYSYAIKETHSTANTMLMFSYLAKDIGTRSFKSAEIYMLSNWVYQTILSVMKDEFDERIFGCDPTDLNLLDFNNIVDELMVEYGVSDMSTVIKDQLMTYWKRQGIIYPVSNYCYAIAFTASLQIYLESKTDYDAATEIYRKIVEEVDGTGEFIATIQKAGLTTPYDEQTYITLNELANIY